MDALDHAARIRRVQRLLARAGAKDFSRASLESESLNETLRVDDVLASVESTLERVPPEEIGNLEDFRAATSLLLSHGERGLRALGRTVDHEAIDGDALASLEALVVADGSRPSFLLREGRVAPDHPYLGEWKAGVESRGERLAQIASAVGRIQPVAGHAGHYIGTGTLVDREAGLVLTNFHVADDARKRFGVAMDEHAGRWHVTGELYIDFLGESGSLATRKCRVHEVLLPEDAGREAGKLDAAVLRIDPSCASELPDAAVMLTADPDYATGGASATLCTIGFPGAPVRISPEGTTIDWEFVVSTLFGNRFGFKRLAPGRFVAPPGSVEGDTASRVLTHDATTFGGASGSLLLALGDPGAAAFGLHFAGRTGMHNEAVAFAVAVDALREVGVPFLPA